MVLDDSISRWQRPSVLTHNLICPMAYCIRPNYCTVWLGFFKIIRKKILVKYSADKDTLYKKRSVVDFMIGLFDDAYVVSFLIFFIKAYVGTHLNCLNKSIITYSISTHLNCINKLMQFKWVPTTYAFIKK